MDHQKSDDFDDKHTVQCVVTVEHVHITMFIWKYNYHINSYLKTKQKYINLTFKFNILDKSLLSAFLILMSKQTLRTD
jgi:exosortase/archaeosortase